MKIVIYSRVSTEDQNIKQQVDKLIEYAKNNSLEVVKVVSDEESGRLPLFERRRFNSLLQALDGIDAVLCINIDRLTRNWDDEAKLERAFSGSCKLISMSEPVDLHSASGRMMFRLKMAVSCYMPEDMREKQAIGIARAKLQKKYKGGKKGRCWAK